MKFFHVFKMYQMYDDAIESEPFPNLKKGQYILLTQFF